jgi:hypothetical protein
MCVCVFVCVCVFKFDAMRCFLKILCDTVVDIRICTWPRSTAPFLGQSGLMACWASMPRGSSRQNMPEWLPAAHQQL